MNRFHCTHTYVHKKKSMEKGKKAEGKNDNNDNTEPNGMKSDSEKLWVLQRFYIVDFQSRIPTGGGGIKRTLP
jgi:hypothetical protein